MQLLPAALEVAVSEDQEFRTGLPLDYLNYTGIVNSESVNIRRNILRFIATPSLQDDGQRGAFFEKLSRLFTKLLQYAPVDAAADQVCHFNTKWGVRWYLLCEP